MQNNLEVWKVSHELTLKVYKITDKFPKAEQFGLTNQLRRSASSMPTNIIEGQARQHPKEFIQFLYIARGSNAETNYHLFLAKELNYVTLTEYQEMLTLCDRIGMMLNKLIKAIK